MIRGIRWTILGISLLWQPPMPLCAQLPPRGITPTPPRPRQTPSPTVPVPAPTTPVVTPSQIPSTGIWTQWRVTVEYRETPDGPWIHYVTQQEQGTDRKVVTLTLWRYKQ